MSFGSNYGWGYKYSHKANHLCYAFFEKNIFYSYASDRRQTGLPF
ncbi:MAG: DUF3788 domain-containing protein [Nitrososphaerota archaeon]|nr:DUF3788 domain-containing protein [Nitrososphaerota archaeon]